MLFVCVSVVCVRERFSPSTCTLPQEHHVFRKMVLHHTISTAVLQNGFTPLENSNSNISSSNSSLSLARIWLYLSEVNSVKLFLRNTSKLQQMTNSPQESMFIQSSTKTQMITRKYLIYLLQ